MMRVLIDARESGTTSGRYLDKMIEYISKIDRDNNYTLLLKNHRLETYSKYPANFKIVECNIKEFTLKEQLNLALMLYKLKPDLVHFPMVQQPLLYFGRVVTTMQDLTTLRFKNPTKNPLIYWVKQKIYWVVNFIAPRKSRQVIAISEYTKQDVIKTLKFKNKDKITTTLESADYVKDEPEEIGSLVGKRYICYVGRHLPHKNLPRLIEAHKILLEKHPDLILAIVGKTDNNAALLMDKIEDEQKKNIIFTGFVSEGQLKWLYQNTACYVFPSLSEGFGLPSLEAMAHGAPVASSNATCLPEINGDGAVYFNPLDPKDISRVVDKVISDKKYSKELIARGKKQVAKYSWERMAKQTLEVYRKALK